MQGQTTAQLVKVAASRWRDSYFRNGNWYSDHMKDIYDKLQALNPPTVAAINSIIGNTSWTSLTCNCCHKDVDKIVALDVTGGEYTSFMCEACLRLALGILEDIK